jgi:transcriptional regulator with XRE-family HTH domain
MLLGEKIKLLRKDRGYSYRKLAELSGISSYSYIRNIEKGTVQDPALSTVMKLARGLGVNMVELLTDVEIPKNKEVNHGN